MEVYDVDTNGLGVLHYFKLDRDYWFDFIDIYVASRSSAESSQEAAKTIPEHFKKIVETALFVHEEGVRHFLDMSEKNGHAEFLRDWFDHNVPNRLNERDTLSVEVVEKRRYVPVDALESYRYYYENIAGYTGSRLREAIDAAIAINYGNPYPDTKPTKSGEKEFQTVTEIGKQINLTAQEMNKLLLELGLQYIANVRVEERNGRLRKRGPQYRATGTGIAYGAYVPKIRKKHDEKAQHHQKWDSDKLLPFLKYHLKNKEDQK